MWLCRWSGGHISLWALGHTIVNKATDASSSMRLGFTLKAVYGLSLFFTVFRCRFLWLYAHFYLRYLVEFLSHLCFNLRCYLVSFFHGHVRVNHNVQVANQMGAEFSHAYAVHTFDMLHTFSYVSDIGEDVTALARIH